MKLTYLQGGGSMQVAVNDSPISGTINTAGTTDTPEGEALRQRIGQLFLRAEGTMN